MSRLAEIPIRIEGAGMRVPPSGAADRRPDWRGGAVRRHPHGTREPARPLAETGVPAAIDLRSLPMSPQDRIELERALGEGEVRGDRSEADGRLDPS